ncbi:MAG: T9SS type A sorting domain-containing protein, partial [Bacteroidota bacterium]
MKSTFLFGLVLAQMTISFAQPQRPQVLYSDTSHTITTSGIFVERGDEYQLLTRKKNFGVIYYRMDTNFQVLAEHPSYLSSTVEDVIPLADGGVIATGYKLNLDYTSKVSAIKIAADGSAEWQAFGAYEAVGNIFGFASSAENSHTILIGKHRELGAYESLTLTKIDSSGQLIWDKEFVSRNGARGMEIVQRANGNYLLLGINTPLDTFDSAGWLLETNLNGDSLHSTFFGARWDYPISLLPSGEGYLVVGENNWTHPGRPISLKLWRFDANLNLEWEKSFRYTDSMGVEHDIRVTKAAKTKDQGCIVLGTTYETIHDSLTENQLYLGKFSSEGILEWEMTLGVRDEANHYPKDVLPLEGGGYLVTARIEDFTPLPGQIYTYYARLSDDGTPVINVSREPDLQELAVEIHPNPFDAELWGSIHLERPNEVQVAVYDLQGRELSAQDIQGQVGQNSFVIATDHLPPASYL